MLAVEFAQYLHEQGLVTFDPDGTTGDAFVGNVPSEPDEVVVLTDYAGPAPDGRLGYDAPRLQIRARAGRDPRTAYQRLETIYAALQNLHGVTLPGGTYLVACRAVQSGAAPLGADQNGRWEYVQNYQLDVRNQTPHRE